MHAIRPLPELAAAAEGLGAAAVLVADEGTGRDLYVTLAALAPVRRSSSDSAVLASPGGAARR